MSKGLAETLNMKSLDEILAETAGAEEEEQVSLPATVEEDEAADSPLMKRVEMTNTSFSGDMDEVFEKAMEMADSAADLANNIDPARAARMFEVAGQQLKIAIDASSAKRDSQLKLMKLIQDQKKLELEELRLRTELGEEIGNKADVIMVEDRNKLLAQIRAARVAEPSPDDGG